MNIGLIGSGGREHTLCRKIFESKSVKKIICFPGNAGTLQFATNIQVDILNFKKLLQSIKAHEIDIVIVGPEEPLVKGLVDFLKKNKIKVFGPSKYAAKLEGSKSFMKRLCAQNSIPTAKFKICLNKYQVIKFLKNCKFPVVVKADGLAAGKGVTICRKKDQVLKVSSEIFKGKFKSSNKLILEEFLKGEEASYFLIVDNNSFKFFGTAQDHKRVKEKDKGPNTGGMGAYSPALIINNSIEKKIINRIVKPTLSALKKTKKPFNGFLYVGLMIKDNNPFLIEYNIRMGDPECQVILPRLKTDLIKILLNAVENKLKKTKIEWKKNKSMTVVICSKGYPGKYQKKKLIKNIDNIKIAKNEFIYHAGTKNENGLLYSNGGRVLNITVLGKKFSLIRKKIIKLIQRINWKYGFYRKDIGWKVIKNENN